MEKHKNHYVFDDFEDANKIVFITLMAFL